MNNEIDFVESKKPSDVFKRKYLTCQTEYGNIEQYNVSSSCKPEIVLDLGVLSMPRVCKDGYSNDLIKTINDKQRDSYTSVVQLQREENYADQSKAKELTIKIYGYDIDRFRDMMTAF